MLEIRHSKNSGNFLNFCFYSSFLGSELQVQPDTHSKTIGAYLQVIYWTKTNIENPILGDPAELTRKPLQNNNLKITQKINTNLSYGEFLNSVVFGLLRYYPVSDLK